jgi:hypothetical protein
MEEGKNLLILCNQILEPDSSVRFAGFPNKVGKLIAHSYRNGSTQLLSEQRCLLYIGPKDEYKKGFKSKLDRPIYSFTLYEKVKKATITLDYDENYPILRLFDIETDP